MTSVVAGRSLLDAWTEASRFVLNTPGHRLSNLVVEVESPTEFDPQWLRRYDPKSVGATDRLSVVAKVLFPASTKMPNEERRHFYERWADVLRRGRKRGVLHSAWGSTYFERLLSLDGCDNQIERMIRALTVWSRREAAIVAHLSSPKADSLRTMGSPCLQFIEILWRTDQSIDLVALYRNHDYLNKAFGNFIGLSRLLAFVASETEKHPGKLVCHSVHAYCESAPKLRALLSR